jgi:hypothetical protein
MHYMRLDCLKIHGQEHKEFSLLCFKAGRISYHTETLKILPTFTG